jgi:V-type H+-transporting ATPase subunit H
MDLDVYFIELCANIRARPVSWDAHQRAGTVSDQNVKLVKSIDKQRVEKRNEIVDSVRNIAIDL